MRVIAGIYRSRRLAAPKGTETRPTSDRLRETVFNIVAGRVEGCRFVDLYAGTGAVGIEALSRGARQVWFAEKAPAALAALRGNLAALGIERGAAVEERGAGALLERLAKAGERVDLIYVDPPYEAAAEYSAALGFMGSERGRAMLAAGALVVIEHSSKVALEERYGGLQRSRTVRQGDAAVSFYSLRTAAALPEG